jgi:multicomponent Na+:H+ antiporter subunit A
MDLLIAVTAGYVIAVTVPWLHRRFGFGRMLFLFPLALTVYFATLLPGVVSGSPMTATFAWVPSLGVTLSFYVDALSLIFALLITGIGTLVFLYSSDYLKKHQYQGRFFVYMLIFMSSMLGVVTASNIFSLFIFWELTSVSSYLLIGLNHDQERSRYAALQALLVTGIGGLALLAGLILLGQVSGNLELPAILAQRDVLQGNALYVPILILVLAGAFTKSAQFPFHFWLPNAMEAPTPVSAYLHSATMVKAGIYLLARLSPVLGGTDIWLYTVTAFGTVTMLAGAYTAIQQTDLKRLLAYSTISALGMITLLLGIGSDIAIKAALAMLVAHALYKGALFLMAGAVDHGTGTRDVTALGGLRRSMPFTTAGGVIAGLSMAGIPLTFGFVAKELFYEATGHSHASLLLTTAAVLASAGLTAVVIITVVRPFFGRPNDALKPHEVSPLLWAGPLVLAVITLVLGIIPGLADGVFSAAASAVKGDKITSSLAIWHGFTPELALSGLTLVLGVGLYLSRKWLAVLTPLFAPLAGITPERLYMKGITGMLRMAGFQTRFLQNGRLRIYLITILTASVLLVGYTLVRFNGLPDPGQLKPVYFHELIIAAVMVAAGLAVIWMRSLLGALVAMGIVGYGTALIYVLFGAPDLAMTQFLVETLTVVLFVLGLYHLPREVIRFPIKKKLVNGLVALSSGALITLLVLAGTSESGISRLSAYFAEHSYLLADGKNVVNVILVDFRGMDTMGEITVLAVSGIGVYALLKLRPSRKAGKK